MKNLSTRLKYYINSHTPYPSIRKFEEAIGWTNNTVNQLTDNPKVERIQDLERLLPELNIDWLRTGKGAMQIYENDIAPVTEQLTKAIERKKPAGKNNHEGTLIKDDDLVNATEIIVPFPGQAGLASKMYPEEMLEEFEKQTIRVKREHRGIFYKIQVDGNSMPPEIKPGDWVRCEDISSMFWMERNFFKKNKIYSIWHNERGIVFKRIVYREEGKLWCVSDNENKKLYPDFELELSKVSRIMVVRFIEREM